MIEAPSIKEVNEHREKNSTAICCILFAPKFSKVGYEEIIKRFGYLDSRTAEKLNIYCVGYGAYWNNDFPDKEEIGIAKYENGTEIPWQFSQIQFANFVTEFTKETKWSYSGGTELIVLNSNADFSSCINFKIDEMIKDKVINFPGELLEALIKHSQSENNNVGKFSLNGVGKQSANVVVESIFEFLPKAFKTIKNIWEKGKHYTLIDITKK